MPATAGGWEHIMKISDRFPADVMAPVKNKDLVAGGSTPGPLPAEAGLAGIINEMWIPDEEAYYAPHAIPNPLADMTDFVALVEEVNREIGNSKGNRRAVLDGLGAERRERYLEWLGLCAVLALRGVYSMCGLHITVKKETLSREGRLDYALLFALDNMGDEYRFLVDRRDGDGPVSGALFYFCQNGVPFAVYNHRIGICPMKQYPAELFQNLIPWYACGDGEKEQSSHAGHRGWKDPVECLAGNGFVEKRLKAWMYQNGFGDCIDPDFALAEGEDPFVIAGWEGAEGFLQEFYGKYLETQSDLGAAMKRSMSDRAAHFCKIYWSYWDGQAGHPLPALLTDQLVLAQYGEGESCGLGYDDEAGFWQPLRLDYGNEASRKNLPEVHDRFAPVIPFTREAMLLYGEGILKIGKLEFCVYSGEAGHLSSIVMKVKLSLGSGRELFAFSKIYVYGDIRGTKIPYLMVWPWVELPKDSWKAFYATQKDSAEGYDGQSCDVDFGGRLTLELDAGEKIRVCERGAEENWEVYRSERRYRYALVQRATTESGSIACGVVMVPSVQEKSHDALTSDYGVSIDFGTTSTVCAVQRDGAQEMILPYRDFSKNVTVGEREKDIEEVAQRRWLGRSASETKELLSQRKTLTVAQLFREENQSVGISVGEDIPFLTGRFFLASSSMLCKYAANGNFESRGIYNDLKLSDGTEIEEQRASTLFLAGVYVQALLYAFSENGIVRRLLVSYPGKLTQLNLKALWEGVANIVNTGFLTDGAGQAYAVDTRKIAYYTEAEAARAYNEKKVFGVLSYINIDIGGGTTDVSGTGEGFGSAGNGLSFKYAGRELIIDSFIECYRHWKGNNRQKSMETHFGRIWGKEKENLPKETKEQVLEFYFAQCKKIEPDTVNLVNSLEQESLRMFEEILLNDFDMNLPDKYDYNMLRSVIMVKFLLLMQMVAGFLKRNKETVLAGGACCNTLEGDVKKEILLVFTGTASQNLQHIFGRDLKQLDGLSSFSIGTGKPEQEMLRYIAQMVAEMAEMEDIELKLQIAPDVQEKKEVAQGMLLSQNAGELLGEEKRWTAEELLDLAVRLPEDTLRKWYADKEKMGLPKGEYVEWLRSYFEEQAIAANVAASLAGELQQMINEKSVNAIFREAQESVEELQKRIEKLCLYGNAINAITGLWPGNAAANADYGFGPGICSVLQILPKGIPLRNMISGCMNDMRRNQKKYRYLASLENEEDRKTMFMVYIMDMVMNKAMSEKQAEDKKS